MRKVEVGKVMYAIFSGRGAKYVQPCKVIRTDDNGFYAQCHNGGDGIEYFRNEEIGNGVYFSKDSARLNL